MNTFTIEIVQKDDGALYAKMNNDGYQTATVTDPLTGDKVMDFHHVRNLFTNLGQVFMERALPDIALKYVDEKLPDGTTRQVMP